MLGLPGILMIIFVIFIGITYLLHRIFKNRYVKYIPPFISLIAGIYYFYIAKALPSEGFKDLARMIMGVMLMAGFLSGLASGVVIDFLLPRFRGKHKKEDSR